jgi:ferrous iron transport protein B
MVLVRTPLVALVGNPNTGKTTLFNALAGMNQRVGNYPGVTVETKKGRMRVGDQPFALIDLPGTYSLAARSPDEMLAVDVILGQQAAEDRPDVVVAIVDASNLERNLYLATQVMELGVPVVIALNMIDIAESQSVRIDAERLARQLGVRVVPIQANKGKGLSQLKQQLAAALAEGPPKAIAFPEAFEREVSTLQEALGKDRPPFLIRRLLLDVGGYTERRLSEGRQADVAPLVRAARQRLVEAGYALPAVEARVRYGWIRAAITECIQRPERRPLTWTDRIDRVLTHKLWGTAVFLALMFLMFQSIFTWARPLMEWIGSGQDALGRAVQGAMEPGPLRSLLVDGVVKGVGSVLVFLPQIVILFGFIAILEDCGYMARAAFLMDRLMSRCGLSGKSFIPLLSSVACAVPGIMAARVIENRRDRFATILVAPLMSCSARLPVYILFISAFLTPRLAPDQLWWAPGLTLFAMYAIGLVMAPLVALCLKRTLLRGETPVFVMEMPLYKWPSWRTVLQRMLGSGWLFVRRAGTLILATMILVWALLYFPHTDAEGKDYDARVAAYEDTAAQYKRSLADLERHAQPHPKTLEMTAEREKLKTQIEEVENQLNELQRTWKSNSILGIVGRTLEPVVRPLGWDWRIGMAAVASFPAREVMVGTLGIIFNQGEVDPSEVRAAGLRGDTDLGKALARDPAFTVPTALSVMVFFALCCQCASTLVVIRRETGTWRWPVFTFVYMTVLAYIGALVVYQLGSCIG